MIRSAYCIVRYFDGESIANKLKTNYVTSNWELVAEMEAVLRPACHYAERVQRDKTVTIGLSWVHILYLKQQLSRPDAYKVVDFSLQWDCKKTFEKLVKKRVLPQNLLPEAQELRQRLIDEVDSYFDRPKDYELLTLVLDPIVWTLGSPSSNSSTRALLERRGSSWRMPTKPRERNTFLCRHHNLPQLKLQKQ